MLVDCGDVVINVVIDGVGGKDDLVMVKFDVIIVLFVCYLLVISKLICF